MLTKEEDDVFKWTSKTHPDMFKYKVFYPSLGERYLIDEDQNLFPGTPRVLYIPCESLNECKNVVILGKSKLFQYLTQAYTGQSPIDSVWNNLQKPSSFDIKIRDDEDIYKYFNLSRKDIAEIESHLPEKTSVAKKTRKKKGGVNKRRTRRAM
jgi:hypothetical protein